MDLSWEQKDPFTPRYVSPLLSGISNADFEFWIELWDTAGQERFRSITKLYYRGASAVILVYSIIDESSFEEMGRWLTEMRENLGSGVVIHVVGTKSDVVAQEPSSRKIPFERCIAYVAENLYPQKASTPTFSGSARSSGFWGQEIGTLLQRDISRIRVHFGFWDILRWNSQACLVPRLISQRRYTDFETVKAGTVVMKLVHQMAKVLRRCSVLLRENLLNRRTRRRMNNYKIFKTATIHRARKEVKVATLKASQIPKEALD